MTDTIKSTIDYMTLEHGQVDGNEVTYLQTGQIEHAKELFKGFNFTRTTLEQWIVIGAINYYYKSHKKNKNVVGDGGKWNDCIRAEFNGINDHQIAGSIYLYEHQEGLLKWYSDHDVTFNNVKYVAKGYRDYLSELNPTSKRKETLAKKQAEEKKDIESIISLPIRIKNIIDEVEKAGNKFDDSEKAIIFKHLSRGLETVKTEEGTNETI